MVIFFGGVSISLVLIGLYMIFGETNYNDFQGVICFVSAFFAYQMVLQFQKNREEEEKRLKEWEEGHDN